VLFNLNLVYNDYDDSCIPVVCITVQTIKLYEVFSIAAQAQIKTNST